MTSREEYQEQLEHIGEIKDLMQRSSRFLSLSGLSGISAGIIALIGAGAAYYRLNYWETEQLIATEGRRILDITEEASTHLLILAVIILILALGFGYLFTRQKAQKAGDEMWGRTSMKLLINLLIPLVAGGIFCLFMYHHSLYVLIAPATLIFYGLACVNASHHTLNDIRYLGIFNIFLGLVNCFFLGYGLVFWAIGFGVMHIIYGSVLYSKYDS